jgi:hypothetical protein
MAKASRTRDVDHGWEAFQRTVHKLARQRPRVLTGITGDHGAALHNGSKRGDSVADIARKNEFGIGCAERSFLRSNFDQNRDGYQKYLVKGMRREVLAVCRGGAEIDAHSSITLKRLGLKVEGDIKRKIKSKISPPNTPHTIRSKGSSTPLVDTAQMIGALASETRKAGA